MAGVLSLMISDGIGTSTSGSPNAVAWGPMYGTDIAASNTQAFAGFTGPISVTGTLSGGGTLFYTLNGSFAVYSGPFSARAGDILNWAVAVGHVAKAGNLTVLDATHSTTLATIAYSVDTSWNGSGYR